MDFPSYVPDGARRFAEHLLQGSSELGLEGYETLLPKDQAELADIDRDIRDWSERLATLPETEVSQSYNDELTELRRKRQEKAAFTQQLELDVAVIRRLVHDSRMKEVYRTLLDTFFGEADTNDKIHGFLHAAWAARMDYTKDRARLKQAREQTVEIAEIAEKLAALLRRITETGEYLPFGFYSVDYLLRETDNTELKGHNLYMWRSMRHTILGDQPPHGALPQADHHPETDPAQSARNAARYIWGLSPPVSALLDTLARAARSYEPAKGGFIGAAITKRQQNARAEYLRGFAYLLTDEHRFDLTIPIMHAMATTTNVVINDPEIDATYDDVRKAVATVL